MNELPPELGGSNAGAFRVSIACIRCRKRHVRCDAGKPGCGQCASRREQCQYTQSRRGGLTREAKAARRDLAAAAQLQLPSLERIFESAFPFPQQQLLTGEEDYDALMIDINQPSHSHSNSEAPSDIALPRGIDIRTSPAPARPLDIRGDPTIDLYYKYFHRYHPFVLPRARLEAVVEKSFKHTTLQPLISVMQFVGQLYARLDQKQWPEAEAISVIAPLPGCVKTPFMVQYHLIHSIALYWSGEQAQSREEMNRAIELALELKMHHRDFAARNAGGDAVLEESWRRTWWQLYIVDSWYAAMKRSLCFPTYGVDATTDLPCEEEDYESGAIPTPKTLTDFEFREFAADDHVYSSFAYLVGVTHDLATVLAGSQVTNIANGISLDLLETVDAVVDGWVLLLPESKQQMLSSNGEIDELMFQAHMAIHASTVAIHRQHSELSYNPLESIAKCSPDPPTRSASCSSNSLAPHTARCLRSITAQIRLLAVSFPTLDHTPFVVCMIATGSISLLSACKFLLTGPQLALARHQIKLSLGYVKSFSKIWTQAANTLHEIQTIARQVLQQVPKSPDAAHNEGGLLSSGLSTPFASTQDQDVAQKPTTYGPASSSLGNLNCGFGLGYVDADREWLCG